MATIGQALTSPETGWKRYDNTDLRFLYNGTWITEDGAGHYNSTSKASTVTTSNLVFKFYGSKVRIISPTHPDFLNDATITIDGTPYTFSECATSLAYQILVFEKVNLTLGVHSVSISFTNKKLSFDAIDVDSTGYLVHPILNQVSDIQTMNIGDCVLCKYVAGTSGVVGTFSELGVMDVTSLLPVAGSATPSGYFYFIHAGFDSGGRMKFVADRNIQHSISWDTLNTAGIVSGEGKQITFSGISTCNFNVRLLTGGISSTDTDNEWDRIIVNSTLNGTITAGSNNIWNWSGLGSMTSTVDASTNNARARRGNTVVNTWGNFLASVTTVAYTGFRPVLIVEILNQAPTLSLNIPATGQYQKTTLINLTGTANDPDGGTISYTITNKTSNTILSQGSGVNVPYSLLFDIDVSLLPLGVNIIEISVTDGSLFVTQSFRVYVLPDVYYIYSKSVMTKNILISKNIDNIMVSVQNSGAVIILYSLDSGTTWAIGSTDGSIDITQSNQVKLRFLMIDSGASLKAYGVGWI